MNTFASVERVLEEPWFLGFLDKLGLNKSDCYHRAAGLVHLPHIRMFVASSEGYSVRRVGGEDVGRHWCGFMDTVSAGSVHIGGVRLDRKSVV